MISKFNRSPLGQSGALHIDAVAVFGIIRLNGALHDNISIENFVHNFGYVGKIVTVGLKSLIKLCGIRDVKIVTLTAVVFVIHAV